MWGLVFCIALSGGIKLSVDEHQFQTNSPILFGFRTSEIKIEKVPFPAVSLTAARSFKRSAIKNAVRVFRNAKELSDRELPGNSSISTQSISNQSLVGASTLLYFMDHICEPQTGLSMAFEDMRRENIFEIVPYSEQLKGRHITDDGENHLLRQQILKATHDCAEMVKYCTWNLKSSKSCSALFSPELNGAGGGCVFNKVPYDTLHKGRKKSLKSHLSENPNPSDVMWKDWSFDSKSFENDETPKKSNDEHRPRNQMKGGRPWGLSFVVKMDDEDFDCPQFDSAGTRVSISVPGIDIDVERVNIAIPPKHEVTIKLYPELTLADPAIKTVPIEKRNCYFENEMNLTFYQKYNQQNCYPECLANHTMKECGCTLLSLPNSAGQKLCQSENITLAIQAERDLMMNGMETHCSKCLPSCSQMTIREEVSLTPYSVDTPDLLVNEKTSIVNIYYAPDTVVAKVRELRHSKFEKIRNIGSIFESTNDISIIGFYRTFFAVLSVFFSPTCWAVWDLLWVLLNTILIIFRKCLVLCGLRRRYDISHCETNELTNESESDDTLYDIGQTVNYDIFLVDIGNEPV